MALIHCIYCSAATNQNLSNDELEEILEQSRVNNASREITGMLLFESGAFFQVLEGEEADVEALYSKIERDPRHHSVRKLITEEIEERAFGEWSMGYPRVTKKDLEEIPGLNDFFAQGKSFMQMGAGRAKTLIGAFQQGRWRA